jgi:hypothetical protein
MIFLEIMIFSYSTCTARMEYVREEGNRTCRLVFLVKTTQARSYWLIKFDSSPFSPLSNSS